MNHVELWRWSTTDERTRRIVTVSVDWRSALHDALLDHNVNSNKVSAEFERLILDPAYGDRHA